METIIYDELVDPRVSNSIQVSGVPEPILSPRGRSAKLYINPLTAVMWYELFDRPLTMEERLEEMTAQNAQIILTLVMNDLM